MKEQCTHVEKLANTLVRLLNVSMGDELWRVRSTFVLGHPEIKIGTYLAKNVKTTGIKNVPLVTPTYTSKLGEKFT